MIRTFQARDLTAITTIWLQENLNAHAFIAAEYWYDNLPMVQQAFGQAQIYVYEDNDQILGFIGIQESYLAGLFVKQNKQRQGIGSQLLQHVECQLPKLKLHVYCQNQKAVSFYQKAGFKITDKSFDENVQAFEYEMCN